MLHKNSSKKSKNFRRRMSQSIDILINNIPIVKNNFLLIIVKI